MEYTVIVELSIVLESFLLGIALAAGYEVIKAIVGKIRKPGIRNMTDALYGVVMAVAVFFLLYRSNGGVMRLFIIGSVAIAFLLAKNILHFAGGRIKIIFKRCTKRKQFSIHRKGDVRSRHEKKSP